MYKYLFIIATLLLVTSNTLLFSQKSNQEKLPAIAVLPFIGSGISINEGDVLAGLLGNALTGVTKGKFSILLRTEAMTKVLEEHNFQDTGLTSTSNRAVMMKGIGADYIITVDVGTLGTKKLAIASMIDINDQKQTAGYYFEYQTIAGIREKLTEISEVLINKTEDNLGKSNSSLAVFPFSVTEEGLASANDAQVLAQMLASSIANSGKYSVAVRTDVREEIRKEYEIGDKGVVNPNDTPKEDEGINADFVLAGSVSKLDNKFVIVHVLTTEGFTHIEGTNIDFKQISDLIEIMPNISYKITGVIDESHSLSGIDYLLESHEGKIGISNIKSLLENGINSKDSGGWTALMYASRYGYADIVKILIRADVSINIKEEDGWTALMMASRYGHADVVNVLIEAGANVSIEYGDLGEDAYVLAKYIGDYPGIANSLVVAGAKAKTRETSHTYVYIPNDDWYVGWVAAGAPVFGLGAIFAVVGMFAFGPTEYLFRGAEPINDIFGNKIGQEFDTSGVSAARGFFYTGIGFMTLGAIFMIVGAVGTEPEKKIKSTIYKYSYEPKNDLFLQPYIAPDIDGSVAIGFNFTYSF